MKGISFTHLLGFFFLFLIPFFESTEKGYGFAFLLAGAGLVGISLLKKEIRLDFLDTLFALFIIFATISTVFSWSFSRSYAELLRYISYFIIFLFVRNTGHRERDWVKIFIIFCILVSSTVFGILSIYFQFFPLTLGSLDLLNFIYPLAGHNHLAGILLFSIPITSGLLLSPNFRNNRIFIIYLFSLLVLQIVSLYFTYSRSAYLLVFLFFCVFVYVKNHSLHPLSKGIFSLMLFISFLFFQFVFLYSFSSKNYLHMVSQLYKPLSNPELRFEYLHQAWEGYRTSPLIGTGPDTFQYVSQNYRSADVHYYTTSDAHNYIIQLMTEMGITGVLPFLMFILYALKSGIGSFKNKQSSTELWFVSASVLTVLNNLVDYDTHFMTIPLFLFISLAMLNPSILPLIQKPKKNISLITSVPVFYILITAVAYMGFNVTLHLQERWKISRFNITQDLLLLLVPWNARFYDQKAGLYETKKNYRVAYAYNLTARHLDPYDGNTNLRGAYLEELLGDYKTARISYMDLIKHQPTDISLYKLLYRNFSYHAASELKSGNVKQAMQMVHNADILFPEYNLSGVIVRAQLTSGVSDNRKEELIKIINDASGNILQKDNISLDWKRLYSALHSLTF